MIAPSLRGIAGGWAAPDDSRGPGLWRWWRSLPVTADDEFITLGEGGTPLLPVTTPDRLGTLWLKDEGRNPTGSHKDRALAIALTRARAAGHRTVVVMSAGSTGVATAAMAARAGLNCVVLVPARADDTLLRPLLALGARVLRVSDPIDVVITALTEHGEDAGFSFCSTTRKANPYQAEAPRTIAYELTEQLPEPPDWVVVPVGGGGTIAGIESGFRDLHAAGQIDRIPRLLAVVADQYDGLRTAFRAGRDDIGAVIDRDLPRTPTLMSKIEHLEPPDGTEALHAIGRSGGDVVAVSDPEALAAVHALAEQEGLLAEPSSAAALAGLKRAQAEGIIADGARVVVLLTGTGHRLPVVLRDEPLPSFDPITADLGEGPYSGAALNARIEALVAAAQAAR